MPSLEDLAEFKQTLADVGGEMAILAARGEDADDVPLPAAGVVQDQPTDPTEQPSTPASDEDASLDEIDLEQLLGSGVDAEDADAAADADDGSGLGDLAALLADDVDDSDAATPTDPFDLDSPAPADETEGANDDFDLESFAEPGAEGAGDARPGDLGDLDRDALDLDAEREEPGDEVSDAPGAQGDFDQGALDADAEPPAPADEASAVPAELADFDLDALDLDGEPTAPAGDPPGDLGDFDLDALDLDADATPPVDELGEGAGDVGDFDLDALDAGPTAQSEDAGETPSGLADFDLDALDAEAEPATSGDELGDLGDFDLDSLDDAPSGDPAEPTDTDFDLDTLETLDSPTAATEDADEGEIAFDLDDPGGGDSEEEPEELSEEISVDSFDEFALPDVGDEFGDISAAADEPPVTSDPGPASAAEPTREATYQISEAAFAQLKSNLEQLPVNLRVAIQDLVAGATASGRVRRVLDMLASGAPIGQLAAEVRRLTGKTIEIPRSFERRTGRELEAEVGSLAYRLRRRLVPALLTLLLVLVGGGGVAFAGYRLVVVPLRADKHYRDGYAMLAEERYGEGVDQFNAAVADRPVQRWHHRYAERFLEKRRRLDAHEFYERTLEEWPADVPAHVALARLQTDLGAYADSERNLLCVLEGRAFGARSAASVAGEDGPRECVLQADIYHFDALLAQADNYLAWARREPEHLENARFHYALTLRQHGNRDEATYGMLGYLVRTRSEPEARILGELLRNREAEVRAAAFTELGAFLLDERTLDGVQEYLFDALEVTPTDPEVHYQISRYFRAANDPGEELRALRAAVNNFGAADIAGEGRDAPVASLADQDRIAHQILAHNRFGELLYARDEILDAESQFAQAIQLFDANVRNRILDPVAPTFGDLFANMGDIHYFVTANRDRAKQNYERAEEIYTRTPPGVDYKLAFLSYSEGDLLDALQRLTRIDQALPANENLLFALGNTFYARGDYFVAQGYYLRLLDMLETRRDSIPVLRIREDVAHDALVDDLMKAYNNLGVTLEALSDVQARDTAKLSQALANLTRSQELYDLLNRESETLVATEAINLAFLNTRGILNPLAEFEPQVYARLARDLRSGSF